MGDNFVSFKVILTESKIEPEIRRFVIDRDVSTSLDYLRSKLFELFPGLRSKTFKITWFDAEGDKVTIRSDDELIIALTELLGPVYKLNIEIVNSSCDDVSQDNVSINNTDGEIHPNVICDGCNGSVIGYRYKCFTCSDFDLCSKCEAKGLHPGHSMMRIADPRMAWPVHLYRRLNRMQDKIQQRRHCSSGLRGEDGPKWRSWESPPAAPCNNPPRPTSLPPGGPSGQQGAAANGQKWLEAMMKGWTGTDAVHAAAHQAAHDAAQAAHHAAHAAASAAASVGGAQGGQDKKTSNSEEFFVPLVSPGEYLKNLGQIIANALDPLGVDVKIDVETPNGETVNVAPSRSEKEQQQHQQHQHQEQQQSPVSAENIKEPKVPMEEAALAEAAKEECLDTTKIEESGNENFQEMNHSSVTKGKNEASFTSTTINNLDGDEDGDDDEEEWTVLTNHSREGTPVKVTLPMPEEVEQGAGANEAAIDATNTNDKPESRDIPIQLMMDPPKVLYASLNGTLYPELPPQDTTPEVVPPQEGAASTFIAPANPEGEFGGARPADRPFLLNRKVDKKLEKLEKKSEKLERKLERSRSDAEREKVEKKVEKLDKKFDKMFGLTDTTKKAKQSDQPQNVTPEVATHPDPRVQVALQAMLNMGFTNDGGWLTQLLELKHGDIGKVLDVLQPVNPTNRR